MLRRLWRWLRGWKRIPCSQFEGEYLWIRVPLRYRFGTAVYLGYETLDGERHVRRI